MPANSRAYRLLVAQYRAVLRRVYGANAAALRQVGQSTPPRTGGRPRPVRRLARIFRRILSRLTGNSAAGSVAAFGHVWLVRGGRVLRGVWAQVGADPAGDRLACDPVARLRVLIEPLQPRMLFSVAPDGSEFLVGETTAGTQDSPAVAADGAGNYVAVWNSDGQDGGGWGVYGRRFDADGNPLGPEFLINETTAGNQSEPSVAAADGGRFVVAWATDQTGDLDVFARAFNADGTPGTGEFRVSETTGNVQEHAAVAADADGDFVVVWQGSGRGDSDGVFYRQFLADGTAAGDETSANAVTAGLEENPAVAMAGDGQFVVTHTRYPAGVSTLFAQRFSAAGVGQGEFAVHATAGGDEDNSSVAMNDAGGFTVVWQEQAVDGDQQGVVARRFGPGGAPLDAGDVVVNTVADRDQVDPSVAFDPSGNAIVVWESKVEDADPVDPLNGHDWGVYGQAFRADGTPDGGEFQINATTLGDQVDPVVAWAGGQPLVAWGGQGVADADGVVGRQLADDAVNDPPALALPSAQTTPQNTTLVLSSGGDNAVAVADADAAASPVRVTLAATNGALTLATVTGLTFASGDGTADAAMTFDGTVAAVNTSLDGLSFTPTTGYVGAATVQVTVSDLGNTGSGGAKTASGTVAVNVGDVAVNTTVADVQELPDLAFNASGQGVAVWVSANQDGDGTGIYAQRLDAGGAKIGGEFRVNQTAAGSQTGASVAIDVAGRFVAVWAENGDIRGRLFDADGTPLTGDFAVDSNPAGTQANPDVAMNASGAFVVTWNGQRSGDTDGVAARRFDASGTPLGGSFAVNTTTTNNQDRPAAALAADGSAVVAWTDQSNPGSEIRAQRIDPSGNLVGPEFIIGNDTGNEDDAAVGVDAAGNFAIAFERNVGAAQTQNIFVRRYSAAGAALDGAAVQVNTHTSQPQIAPSISVRADGAFAVAWQSQLQDGDQYGIFAQQFATDGTASGGEFRVNSTTAGTQKSPAAAWTGSGLAVAWHGNGPVDADGIYAQVFRTAAGGGAANQPPVNTVPAAQVVAEDSTLVFSTVGGNAVSVADPDAGTAAVRVSLSVTGGGALTLASAAGIGFTTGDGVADGDMTFTGTLAAVNAALDGLVYRPAADFSGAATVTVTADDLGNSGTGGAMTDSDAVAVTVTAVNDAPVNALPPGQSIDGGSLLFSSSTGSSISVADVDAGASAVQVALAASAGTLSLGSTAGLTFVAGDGTNDSSMTFRGTLSAVNSALEGMTYDPPFLFLGTAEIDVTTSDLGNTGAGGAKTDADTLSVGVTHPNAAPVNTVPGAQTVAEDGNLIFSAGGGNGISVADADAATVRTALAVTNGALSLGGTAGLTFTTGDGTADAAMTFTGTLADVNNALGAVVYSPTADYHGGATLTVTTNDQGSSGSGGAKSDTDTVPITVTPVNDAPVVANPISDQAATEDVPFAFQVPAGIFADADAGDALTYAATLADGSTMPAWLGFDVATRTFTGTPRPGDAGPIVVRVTATDGSGATGSDTFTLTVAPVNDAPVVTVPGAQAVDQDSPVVFSSANGRAISVTDEDAGGGPLRVTLSATSGRVSLYYTDGLTFLAGDGRDDATVTFEGTPAAVNRALDHLRFDPTPGFVGSASLQVTADDLGHSGDGGALTDADTIPITFRSTAGAPSVTHATTDEDTQTAPGTLVVTAKPGLLNVNHFRITNITGGTLYRGNGTSRVADGEFVSANQAAGGLRFTPDPDSTADGHFTVQGATNGNLGGLLPGVAVATIVVNPVNDAPVNGVPGPQASGVGVPVEFSAANANPITVADVDAGDGDPVRVTLAATNGTVALGAASGLTFSAGDGSNDATVTFTGTPDDVHAALDGLRFDPAPGHDGPATLTVTGNDLGAHGRGGAKSDTDTIRLGFGPNDAPALSAPASTATPHNTPLVFSAAAGNPVSAADPDAGSGPVRVTLTPADGGRITLATTAGLTFTAGGGTNDAVAEFTGTVAAVNAALNGLAYRPDPAFAGLTRLDLTVDDLGNAGTGGPRAAAASVPIAVAPPDAAPGVTVTPASGLRTSETGQAETFSVVLDRRPTADVAIGLQSSDPTEGVPDASTLTFTPDNWDVPQTVTVTGADDLADDGDVAYAVRTLPARSADPAYNGLDAADVSVTNADDADPPAATTSPGAAVYVEGAAPEEVDYGLILEADEGLTGATVSVQSGYVRGQDELRFAAAPGSNISGSWDPAAGRLTLGGPASAAEYQAALRSVAYANTSQDPDTRDREVDFTVVNARGAGVRVVRGLRVTAVNTPPVNDVPGPQQTSANTPLVFSAAAGNPIRISDADAGGGTVDVTIRAAKGTITFPNRTGLRFSLGNGESNFLVQFSGTLESVNAALDGLRFDPRRGYTGPASLRITTNDLGNRGAGGPKTVERTVDITVRPTAPTPAEPDPVSPEPPAPPAPPVPVTPPPLPNGGGTMPPPAASDQGFDSGTGEGQTDTAEETTATDDGSTGTTDGGGSDAGGEPAGAPPAAQPEPAQAEPAAPPGPADGDPAPAPAQPPQAPPEATPQQSEVAQGDGGGSARGGAATGSTGSGLGPGPTGPYDVQGVQFVLAPTGGLSQDLDELKETMTSWSDVQHLFAGSAAFVSVGASVVWVLWTVRAGYLVTSMLSSMPAWKMVDPLPILDHMEDAREKRKRREEEDEDPDSLESLVGGGGNGRPGRR